jgi:A/G-specific adenine glycosylase
MGSVRAPASDRPGLQKEKFSGLQQAVLAWYRQDHRQLPWRHTHDPYAILVAEVMLQQTQVDRVIPKYRAFLARYPSLADLAAASRAEVITAWSGLGYNLRAVRLHEIAKQVVERWGGRLPRTLAELRSLKGIGRYTAGAIACFAYGEATPAMDTNVRRVLTRIFAAEAPAASQDDKQAWELAEAVLPVDDAYDWNQALMDLGAVICLSRGPRCLLCPAQDLCSARREWTAASGEERLVAEGRATYAAGATGRRATAPLQPRTKGEERFEGSRRWYRGRIVEALRQTSGAVDLDALGTRVKPDYTPDERSWLLELVGALARDGLVSLTDDGASLPP